MRILGLLTFVTLISCARSTDKIEVGSKLNSLDSIKTIKKYQGDSLIFKLTKDEVEQIDFESVDSIFYNNYLRADERFQGFNVATSAAGGYNCNQYYYGIVKNRIPGYKQILILQVYNFNDTDNDLFLLTFNSSDSLTSILQVSSLVYQAEIEPIFSSIMHADNRITKYEIVINHIPDNMDMDTTTIRGTSIARVPVNERFLFCKDSVTKEFKFKDGMYIMTKKDSVRPCVWKDEW